MYTLRVYESTLRVYIVENLFVFKMRFFIYTLGCRLNQAESFNLTEKLQENGHILTCQKPNFIIINSCSVTHKADRESRQIVRTLKRRHPQAKIIFTGCSRIKIPEVDYCILNKEKIIEIVGKIESRKDKNNKKHKKRKKKVFIKIQDGCDEFCTYCIVPYRRGKPQDRNEQESLEEIKKREQQGYQEIVLTGANIGKYKNLAVLVTKILQQTKIPKISFGSIAPQYINDQFLSLWQNPRLKQHLHLSLQSGSDTVLKRMNRQYTTKKYLTLVRKIYKLYPDFQLTTDIIVGFPGETEGEFKETYQFVKKCRFAKLHIFRYSKREGTAAAKMSNQVDEKSKRKRARILENML